MFQTDFNFQPFSLVPAAYCVVYVVPTAGIVHIFHLRMMLFDVHDIVNPGDSHIYLKVEAPNYIGLFRLSTLSSPFTH